MSSLPPCGGGNGKSAAKHLQSRDSFLKQPGHTSPFPRRYAPEVCSERPALKNRGRRKRRVPAAPAASRAKQNKAHERIHHRFTEQSGVSCAMVLTASFVLFPESGLVSLRRPRKLPYRELDASVGAPEPHGFSVRKPTPSSKAPLASIASRPASVTCATPLCGTGRDEYRVIFYSIKQKYFSLWGLTSRIENSAGDLPDRQNHPN